MNISMLKKGDVFLIIGLIAACLLLMAGINMSRKNEPGTHKVAVVKQGDKVLYRIDLDELTNAKKYPVTGDYHLEVYAEKGKICFLDADCPDLVCVKTGWLTKAGDTAVCIPNKTIIKIEGEKSEVDGVTF